MTTDAYSYSRMMQRCGELTAAYPFLSLYPIGRSVLGQPLAALRLGYGPRRIHMNASFHANEWITSALLMRFLEELCEAYAYGEAIGGHPARALLASATLWAVPMVNPDGVELAQGRLNPEYPLYCRLKEWNGGSEDFSGWKANIRGVDLNDQFPAFWLEECKRRGVQGPASSDYPGPCPLSEPEAEALAELTERLRFDAVVALHTQGREIYWNYRDMEPPHAEGLADRLGAVSGYKPVRLSGSDAGYKDWFIQRFRKPGFTVEAGWGKNPLPMNQFDSIYTELQPLLAEALRL
ncbi:M14 family metallocarboxypeptidase [Paenibacillus sp. J5C_2022]|uniref:M14 family metallopeptidase n=1 Tax=Paenibacillus sp. J5C2022 TaxID=2977129 RepID=UPI0021D09B37|nr:M14 family metallocarboxypeptidase [Paenibacillus sp. J5C2022]MCU6707570.1 M14 family metallocarboxypeptidase [Paenibacillus sp. J5C2022]